MRSKGTAKLCSWHINAKHEHCYFTNACWLSLLLQAVTSVLGDLSFQGRQLIKIFDKWVWLTEDRQYTLKVKKKKVVCMASSTHFCVMKRHNVPLKKFRVTPHCLLGFNLSETQKKKKKVRERERVWKSMWDVNGGERVRMGENDLGENGTLWWEMKGERQAREMVRRTTVIWCSGYNHNCLWVTKMESIALFFCLFVFPVEYPATTPERDTKTILKPSIQRGCEWKMERMQMYVRGKREANSVRWLQVAGAHTN